MIYLDNAATTYPKPPCVSRAMEVCMRDAGGNPGRSGHPLSVRAAEEVYAAREAVAAFFGSDKPENVVFTLNTTYALHIAIRSLYIPGSHILISNMEHNSVFRPIHALSEQGQIEYDIFNVLQPTDAILEELDARLRPDTRMLILTHASNLCGSVFPIREVGRFCKRHGITFLVDAAQSAGVLPIHMEKDSIDALCAPAHKGLYGPTGLGFVLFGKSPLRPVIFGGNGVRSLDPDMGDELPESMEAGTLPVAAIAGLRASLRWLNGIGCERINTHETVLAAYLQKQLSDCPGLQLYGPALPQTGIVLFDHESLPLAKLTAALQDRSICTRSGFHCCPLGHSALHTGEEGAIRVSLGYFNTKSEIDRLCDTLYTVCHL